jgi:hypothetical protein
VPKKSDWAGLQESTPEPAVGQVWQSCDIREVESYGDCRRVRIDEIFVPPGGRRKARCTVISAGTRKRKVVGRQVEILVARLFPHATGYRYIEGP